MVWVGVDNTVCNRVRIANTHRCSGGKGVRNRHGKLGVCRTIYAQKGIVKGDCMNFSDLINGAFSMTMVLMIITLVYVRWIGKAHTNKR